MIIKHLFQTALLLGLATSAHAADTLADMDIAVTPELWAMGIEPGERHARVGEIHIAEAAPQFVRNQPGPVVYIGDSIIAFLPSGLLPAGALNLAVSGATTGYILSAEVPRIPLNASRVVIEGGINDALNPQLGNNTAANYAAILADLPKSAKVSVVGILPVNEAQLATNRDFALFVDNTKIAATNTQIAAACHCALATVPPVATVDGIHPTAAGQAVLAKALH